MSNPCTTPTAFPITPRSIMKKHLTTYLLLIAILSNLYNINSVSKRVNELWDIVLQKDEVISLLLERQNSIYKQYYIDAINRNLSQVKKGNFIEVFRDVLEDDITQIERCDSVCKMLNDIQAIGERIIAQNAVSPQVENLSFHKTLDSLVKNAAYNCLAEGYAIRSLEATIRLLEGNLEKARAKKNAVASNNFLYSYIARVTVINEFIRLQFGQIYLSQKTIMAISEDTDHVNYNKIREYTKQKIRVKRMERATMETLAAIPEEYDGSKYQQNLYRLKKDVDSLLSEVSRIE